MKIHIKKRILFTSANSICGTRRICRNESIALSRRVILMNLCSHILLDRCLDDHTFPSIARGSKKKSHTNPPQDPHDNLHRRVLTNIFF
jgi:hypothetical protein